MSDAHPEGPPQGGEPAPAEETPLPTREGAPAEPSEGDRTAGGDEILKTRKTRGAGRRDADGTGSDGRQGLRAGTRGAGGAPGAHPGPVPRTVEGRYRGWLPSGSLLTPGEVATAGFVAELAWATAGAVLLVAERLAVLPEPAARSGFLAALLFGLACGLYVLVGLRSRRLVRRRHLRGER